MSLSTIQRHDNHALDCSAFGLRVLKILKRSSTLTPSQRIRLAGDAVIFLGNSTGLDQSDIDSLSLASIHDLIRQCQRRSRIDRWVAIRRESAVQFAEMIDTAVQPIRSFEPSEEQSQLLRACVERLRSEVREDLSAGYTVQQAARRSGLDASNLRRSMRAIRATVE